jgi:hypothetical protein
MTYGIINFRHDFYRISVQKQRKLALVEKPTLVTESLMVVLDTEGNRT